MAATITISLDAQGNSTIGKLPPGVFYSRFATPPDAAIRDVISINAAGTYAIVINGPGLTGATATPPLTLVSSAPGQATFSLSLRQLPAEQDFGMALCQVGAAAGYSVAFVVNPASLSLPLVIDQGGIQVDPDDVPIGVHCDPAQNKLAVWAGGGYSFAFSLPAGSLLRFEKVELKPDSPMLSSDIGEDKLTAWVFNNNLASHSGFSVDVKFYTSSISGENGPVLDPTIINNPINQGGGNTGMGDPVRSQPASALVH